MSSRGEAVRKASDFVQLLREFLLAHEQLTALLEGIAADDLSFEAIRGLVGDDDRSVLYRLKEKSHALFRSGGYASASVRREALFDLEIGSLFHESLKLRESLYQREVYAPRVASLRAAAGDEAEMLFVEFDRILERSGDRVSEVVLEVRDLLVQTRDQFRLLIVERAGERGVTRTLLSRRAQVDAAFPEGFDGLLEAMHGDFATGLVEAAHALVESAYFVEAMKTLREALRQSKSPLSEIDQLLRYSEGMQAFLDGDYAASIAALEAWVDLGALQHERAFARRAASALGRLGRLVENDAAGAAIVDAAKQLQLRLEADSG
ncbi:MAG: hypothetical protein GY910_14845 [bacterium]|nr:hypothetical protein [bacterium]